MLRRISALLGATAAIAAILLLTADPAGAILTNDKVVCTGSAIITDDDGKQYPVDAADSKATVPKNGTAAWQGSVSPPTHNHTGEVVLELPLTDIELGAWGPSPNTGNEPSRTGTKNIPSAVEQLPPGEYVVSGFHRGDEGGCTGTVTVVIEGGILSTPAGIVSVVGTVLTGGLLGLASMAKGAVR
jgi:hypothetical protein